MGFWSDLGKTISGAGVGLLGLIPGAAPFTTPIAAGLVSDGLGGMLTPEEKAKQGLTTPERKPDVNYLDSNYVDAIRRLGGS